MTEATGRAVTMTTPAPTPAPAMTAERAWQVTHNDDGDFEWWCVSDGSTSYRCAWVQDAEALVKTLNAMSARVAELEREGATLAAGQCIISMADGGLTNDDYGNQFCAMRRRALAAEAQLKEARALAFKHGISAIAFDTGETVEFDHRCCNECLAQWRYGDDAEHEGGCAIAALKDTTP